MSLPFSLSFDSSRARDSLLAAISYEERPDGSVFQAGLKSLGNGPTLELWTSSDPVHAACAEGVHYRHNGRALFGLCSEPSRADIEQQAFDVYLRIQRMLEASSYPYLLRMWNHFPDIHGQTEQVSRYQSFCLGRQRALEAAGKLDESALPAATVIGTRE